MGDGDVLRWLTPALLASISSLLTSAVIRPTIAMTIADFRRRFRIMSDSDAAIRALQCRFYGAASAVIICARRIEIISARFRRSRFSHQLIPKIISPNNQVQ